MVVEVVPVNQPFNATGLQRRGKLTPRHRSSNEQQS